MPKALMPGAMLYLAHGEFTHDGTQQNLDNNSKRNDNQQSARGNSRNTHFKIHNRAIDLSLILIGPHTNKTSLVSLWFWFLHLWLIWWMTAMLEKR